VGFIVENPSIGKKIFSYKKCCYNKQKFDFEALLFFYILRGIA